VVLVHATRVVRENRLGVRGIRVTAGVGHDANRHL